MNIAIVQSSQLGNRWDAQFHILAQQHKQRTNELASAIGETNATATALDMLANTPAELRKILHPLIRTGRNAPGQEEIRKAVEEYPYLAIAALESIATQIVAYHNARSEAALAAAAAFQATLPKGANADDV